MPLGDWFDLSPFLYLCLLAVCLSSRCLSVSLPACWSDMLGLVLSLSYFKNILWNFREIGTANFLECGYDGSAQLHSGNEKLLGADVSPTSDKRSEQELPKMEQAHK